MSIIEDLRGAAERMKDTSEALKAADAQVNEMREIQQSLEASSKFQKSSVTSSGV